MNRVSWLQKDLPVAATAAISGTPGKCRRCEAPISPSFTLCAGCFQAVYYDDEPEALPKPVLGRPPKPTSDLNRLAGIVAAVAGVKPWTLAVGSAQGGAYLVTVDIGTSGLGCEVTGPGLDEAVAECAERVGGMRP